MRTTLVLAVAGLSLAACEAVVPLLGVGAAVAVGYGKEKLEAGSALAERHAAAIVERRYQLLTRGHQIEDKLIEDLLDRAARADDPLERSRLLSCAAEVSVLFRPALAEALPGHRQEPVAGNSRPDCMT